MAQCMYKMVLDVTERDSMQTLVARQGDSATRFLRLHLLSLGEPIGVEETALVSLNARNAADEVRSFEGKVNADGSVTLPIGAWMLKSVGPVLCDVSVFDTVGGRLTTPTFEVEVIPSVADPDLLQGDTEGASGLTARIFAEERVTELLPVTDGADGFLLLPECNRKYALNLSGNRYAADDGFKKLALKLPDKVEENHDNWVLMYCHAPLIDNTQLTIDWGNREDVLFANGEIPSVTKGDFDIICTYSRAAKKWQIGIVQYEAAGAGA